MSRIAAFVRLQDAARELALDNEMGLVEDVLALTARVEAAIRLAERTETTSSGVRVVRRGTAGGRAVKAGGCP